jgi:hypothetical protein
MTNQLPASLNYLCPWECELERIGGNLDGGYAVPSAAVRSTRNLFSIGISTDWSFEKMLSSNNKKMRIFAHDRSVGSLVFLYFGFRDILKPKSKNTRSPEFPRIGYAWTWIKWSVKFRIFFSGRHHFVRRWVKPIAKSSKEISFTDAFSKVPHSGSIVIKIDIEGDEYGLKDQITASIIERKGQISTLVFELHDTDTRRVEFEQFVREISQLMPLVHIHGNNCRKLSPDGLPTFVEVTFAHPDLVGKSKVLNFPVGGLDFPNDPELPDLDFSFSGSGL